MMKCLILALALFAAAAALPTDIESRNATHRLARQSGFASWMGGTYGGRGGATFTVWDAWALRDALLGDAARIINIMGRIDLTNLFTGSPGVVLHVGSFKTIQGGNANAEIFGGGIRCTQRQQLIFQNLRFTNALNYAPGEQPNGNGGIISMVNGAFSTFPAMDLDQSEFIHIDHNEFSNDPWIAASVPENQRRHHSIMSIKRAATAISVSNSIFRNINLNILVGHDDSNGWQDIGRLLVSFYGNWFRGAMQRSPRVRFGLVHVFNNLYTDVSDYGIGIGVRALIYAERNVFINVRRAWGLMAVNQNPAGALQNVDNWLLSGSTIDSNVPSNIGWNPSSYYSYSPLATGNVENSVRNNAGTWW